MRNTVALVPCCSLRLLTSLPRTPSRCQSQSPQRLPTTTAPPRRCRSTAGDGRPSSSRSPAYAAGTEASEWLLTGSNRRHSPCKGCPAAQAANLGYKAVWQLFDSVGDELIENLWAGRPLQASSTEEHG